jgi:prepilin-type processing-associated H-X9-DG protein
MPPLVGSLGGHFPGGFNTLFLDGSVKFLKVSINPVMLKALITRDRGEVVSVDSF